MNAICAVLCCAGKMNFPASSYNLCASSLNESVSLVVHQRRCGILLALSLRVYKAKLFELRDSVANCCIHGQLNHLWKCVFACFDDLVE